MATSFFEQLSSILNPQQQPVAAPTSLIEALSLRNRLSQTDANSDPQMAIYNNLGSTQDTASMPDVTDAELHNQLIANYFNIPPDQRDINSPYMQAVKQKIQANRMQLNMQQAKDPKRYWDI